MKTILTLVFFAATASQACTTNDSWKGADKRMHFAAGAALGAAGTLAFKDPAYGLILGAGVGLVKELADKRGNGTCSFQDFAVTALGAAAGAYGTAFIIAPRKKGVFVGFTTTF